MPIKRQNQTDHQIQGFFPDLLNLEVNLGCELKACLERDGYDFIEEAVGADHLTGKAKAADEERRKHARSGW